MSSDARSSVASDAAGPHDSHSSTLRDSYGKGGKSHNMVNKGWTQATENICIEWSDHAMCYVKLHSDTESAFVKKDRYTAIFLAVSGVLTGLLTAAASNWKFHESVITPGMLFGGITVAVQIAQVVLRNMDYSFQAKKHNELGNAWGILQSQLIHEIVLPSSDRRDYVEFFKEVGPEYDRLRGESSGTFPEGILKAFKKYVGREEGLNTPEILGNLTPTKNRLGTWLVRGALLSQVTKASESSAVASSFRRSAETTASGAGSARSPTAGAASTPTGSGQTGGAQAAVVPDSELGITSTGDSADSPLLGTR